MTKFILFEGSEFSINSAIEISSKYLSNSTRSFNVMNWKDFYKLSELKDLKEEFLLIRNSISHELLFNKEQFLNEINIKDLKLEKRIIFGDYFIQIQDNKYPFPNLEKVTLSTFFLIKHKRLENDLIKVLDQIVRNVDSN